MAKIGKDVREGDITLQPEEFPVPTAVPAPPATTPQEEPVTV